MEEALPRALPRDVPDYHERQAAHFRALAEIATTRPAKARLLYEAEEHEQIARGEPVLAVTDGRNVATAAGPRPTRPRRVIDPGGAARAGAQRRDSQYRRWA